MNVSTDLLTEIGLFTVLMVFVSGVAAYVLVRLWIKPNFNCPSCGQNIQWVKRRKHVGTLFPKSHPCYYCDAPLKPQCRSFSLMWWGCIIAVAPMVVNALAKIAFGTESGWPLIFAIIGALMFFVGLSHFRYIVCGERPENRSDTRR